MSNNKSELKVIKTGDGSFSIYNTVIDETYHSVNGALQESRHVFIQNGFKQVSANPLHILEIGLGTGLNAALSILEANKAEINLVYEALEPFPLSDLMVRQIALGYSEEVAELQLTIANIPQNQLRKLSPYCSLKWHIANIQTFIFTNKYDLIYFDAFAPDKQNEVWTLEIFCKLYETLNLGGLLTTYCAKGVVKRMLKQAGFLVKTVPGPPGKREMTIAIKEG